MKLDPRSPIPLYAQLAEAIRYEIATGAIPTGDMLPALRIGARRWGVNLHTVRRAYAELAERGVVRTDPQRGTVVLGRGPSSPSVDPVEWFISRMVTEAHERHGLNVAQLKLRLDQWGSRLGGRLEQPVHVVERAEPEASHLATQLRAVWAILAEPWSLERPGAPPAGSLVAPLQHYNEVRVRWPDRLGDVHFLPTRPDPSLASRIVRSPRPQIRAVLCELDVPTAASAAADLRRVLPPGRVEVVSHIVGKPGELLSFVPDSIDAVLFPPRMWEKLNATERSHPKAVEIRYVFEGRGVERLAEDLGWARREA